MTADRALSDAEIATEMFLDKWGFDEPAPAYRAAYDADLRTIAFLVAFGAPHLNNTSSAAQSDS